MSRMEKNKSESEVLKYLSIQFGGSWPSILVLVFTVQDFLFRLDEKNKEHVEFIKNPRKTQ